MSSRRGIRLRAYGQQDPVIAYREEGFDMFDAMIDTIRENTARMILTVRLKTPEAPKREAVAKGDRHNILRYADRQAAGAQKRQKSPAETTRARAAAAKIQEMLRQK